MQAILASMDPSLLEDTFLFVNVTTAGSEIARCASLIAQLRPISTVQEAEGLSLIVSETNLASLPDEQKGEIKVETEAPMRMISLTVHSALTMCGLSAALSRKMADAEISCNIVAGFYHDHLFVDAARAQDAMVLLEAMKNGD